MKPGTLLIRADASPAIGTGHVMRCVALAQAWQDAGGDGVFAMAEATPAIKERLRNENLDVVLVEGAPGSAHDRECIVALCRSRGPSWVAVDGYEFSWDYVQAIRNEGLRVLLIDDNGRAGKCTADVVVNQNLHAGDGLYQERESYTKLLLGTKYALLRREFVSVQWAREFPPVGRKLLVSMGGSDPENVTLRVMEALEKVDVENLEVAVVVGGSNPHLASVAELVSNSRHRGRVLNNVANMQEVVAWADFAVSAAGSTCWEYCALGLPAILVIIAENQVWNAESLQAAQAARLIAGGARFAVDEMARLVGDLANSAAERQALSRIAGALVDGGGAGRVVSTLISGMNS